MEKFFYLMIWAFAVFGITIIVTQSMLFKPIRDRIEKTSDFLGTLFSCPLCFSFWASIATSLLLGPVSDNLFFDGCIGSGSLWFFTYRNALLN
tara:strand:+ start:66 stop:344 length:279 start_codon:yes stop_codon:yes gene_type:complete